MGDFIHALFGLHTMFRTCIRLQIGAGIFAHPTADAVATGEVNGYNSIVRFSSNHSFTETASNTSNCLSVSGTVYLQLADHYCH